MKSIFLMILGCLCILTACNTNDDLETNIEGDYMGTFERDGTTSNVTLNFNNGTFTGTSETDRFPAICNGDYTIEGDMIQFQDMCIWTADFDWTLILNGDWEYTWKSNTLTLDKANGDRYVLNKQ